MTLRSAETRRNGRCEAMFFNGDGGDSLSAKFSSKPRDSGTMMPACSEGMVSAAAPYSASTGVDVSLADVLGFLEQGMDDEGDELQPPGKKLRLDFGMAAAADGSSSASNSTVPSTVPKDLGHAPAGDHSCLRSTLLGGGYLSAAGSCSAPLCGGDVAAGAVENSMRSDTMPPQQQSYLQQQWLQHQHQQMLQQQLQQPQQQQPQQPQQHDHRLLSPRRPSRGCAA